MRTSQVLALLGGVLHVFVLLALTIRSAQIARALFPFDRSLANEWIHLLFFVPGDGDTLPHFLLEIEEEIAVDLDNEFFHTGFAHRSSASPVGMLFTISEARQHVHGAVRNYFALPQVALQPFVVAGMEDPTRGGVNTPMPELTVQVSNQTDTVTTKVSSFVLYRERQRRAGTHDSGFSTRSQVAMRAIGRRRCGRTVRTSMTRERSLIIWTPCNCASWWASRRPRSIRRCWRCQSCRTS